MATSKAKNKWQVVAMDPPKLSAEEWNMTMVLGLVFIVTAVLQLISFSDFKDALTSIGLPSPATWGAILIIAELWASAALFKLKLSMAFRMASSLFAVLVSGFWFFESVRLVSTGSAVTNSGLLGRFLMQSPGWWPVIETTLVLFWTLYAVGLTKADSK